MNLLGWGDLYTKTLCKLYKLGGQPARNGQFFPKKRWKKTTYINLHWPRTSHSFVLRFTTILSLETLVNCPAGRWQRRVLEWWEWELDWGNYPDRPWIDIWWNIVISDNLGTVFLVLIVNQTGSNHCKQNIAKKWYWSSDSSNVVSVRTKHGFAINNSGFI